MLDLGAGEYYSLDAVGSTIWEQLRDGQTEEEIVGCVVTTYEVEEATARGDVARIIQELVVAGLVEPHT